MNVMNRTLVMPRARMVGARAVGALRIEVTWSNNRMQHADLAPVILAMRFFRPLRADTNLFSDIHVRDEGTTLGWGRDELELEMDVETVERLAQETYSADDFREFLVRNELTHVRAAHELGRSRRQVENYLRPGAQIPRIVTLACLGYEARRQGAPTTRTYPALPRVVRGWQSTIVVSTE